MKSDHKGTIITSKEPLSNAEYFNRSQQLIRSAREKGMGADVPAIERSSPYIPTLDELPLSVSPNPIQPVDFPVETLVNLPRFIVPDTKPFAFVNTVEHAPEHLRLPYPEMLFELGESKTLIVATQINDDEIRLDLVLPGAIEAPFEVAAEMHVAIEKGQPLRILYCWSWYSGKLDLEPYMAVIGFVAEHEVGNAVISTLKRTNPDAPPPVRSGRKFRIVRVLFGDQRVPGRARSCAGVGCTANSD